MSSLLPEFVRFNAFYRAFLLLTYTIAAQGPKRALFNDNHAVDLGAVFLQLRYNTLVKNV